MMGQIANITDAQFAEEVLAADRPVLVDFWAEWCGPCKAIAPILEEVSSEYADQLKIVKIDTDRHTEAMLKYGIMSLPTMLLFRDGEPVLRMVGARPKRKLLEDVLEHISVET
jgi:thioredoxin 1